MCDRWEGGCVREMESVVEMRASGKGDKERVGKKMVLKESKETVLLDGFSERERHVPMQPPSFHSLSSARGAKNGSNEGNDAASLSSITQGVCSLHKENK